MGYYAIKGTADIKVPGSEVEMVTELSWLSKGQCELVRGKASAVAERSLNLHLRHDVPVHASGNQAAGRLRLTSLIAFA